MEQENMNVVEFGGEIVEKAIKETKSGQQYYEFKINEGGRYPVTRKWFNGNDPAGIEVAKSIKKGDMVSGIGEDKESEYNGQPITFHNISSMTCMNAPPQVEDVVPTPQPMKFVPGQQFQKPVAKAAILPNPLVQTIQQIKVITADTQEGFEANVNEFMKTHKVFATQTHIETVNNRLVAILYYQG